MADAIPGQGPLGGVLAALRERDLMVLAGDLPAIQGRDLERIVRAAARSDAALVLARARSSGQKQPLCGLWRASVQSDLASYFESGGRSVFGFVERVRVQWVAIDDAHLVNINRPEDLDLLPRMS